ncbi:hypothetical protein F5148DRAFT_1278920 [Russula earlei]|uniref:Uncharacterized protein n=1 Tax=Russula earlei TaxID=71964 RepID=A0ACC0UNG0_9AGAM|nr:hypothetical protein F5148DRAFT_1278920 [Russula earlei]
MSDLYSSLYISPKKKRFLSVDEDETTLTPKRLRARPPSPPKTIKAKIGCTSEPISGSPTLPPHLSRLFKIQTSLQHALSHALASSAASPSAETGILRNVVNHHSLNAYAGLSVELDMNDLSRLCWLWEWEGDVIPPTKALSSTKDDNPNPFLEDPSISQQPKDWTRGSMGFVINPTTHFSKTSKSRIPAYGIGIEVEMDLDKDMGSGMASVARWTADGETRRQAILSKLRRWVEDTTQIPNLPMADLPQLIIPNKPSTLTRLLASASPKTPSSIRVLSTPPSPTSPTKASKASSSNSPTKGSFALPANTPHRLTPSLDKVSAFKARPIATSSIQFPKTPSRRALLNDLTGLLTPRTPSVSPSKSDADDSLPSTPVQQKGSNADTVPQTPSSSRRQALYERVRQKSLTNTPAKTPSKSKDIPGGKMSRDQLLKLSQEEMRRRVLLGRLEGIAESVWMLFAGPSTTTLGLSARKRRALPTSEVAGAVLKSSPVPMSSAEAHESLTILTSLCPFFLKPLDVDGQEWLEMPASVHSSSERLVPTSPGSGRAKHDDLEGVLARSPRRVKKEGGSLREVRERIRREIEMQD